MSRRALHPDQALDALSAAEQAIERVRAVIEIAPDVAPVLIASYRALSALAVLRDAIDSAPIATKEEKT